MPAIDANSPISPIRFLVPALALAAVLVAAIPGCLPEPYEDERLADFCNSPDDCATKMPFACYENTCEDHRCMRGKPAGFGAACSIRDCPECAVCDGDNLDALECRPGGNPGGDQPCNAPVDCLKFADYACYKPQCVAKHCEAIEPRAVGASCKVNGCADCKHCKDIGSGNLECVP